MKQTRIESLKKKFESKVLEADENIKMLLSTTSLLPDHTNLNKEIEKWIEIKSNNFSKLQHILSYLPNLTKEKDGK
tara:strand:+ start:573 stop:800 length:228 start_codon:yes stop_codon:yes gene_type:complete